MRAARRVREGTHGKRTGGNIGTAPVGLPHRPRCRYHDLGAGYYASRIDTERKTRNHIRQLEALGYTVTLAPAA